MLFISRLLPHSLPTGCREEPEILLIKNKDADAKQVEDLISKMDGVIVGYNTILHEYQIQFKTISSLSDLTDICFELSQSELVRNCYPNYVYSDDLNSYYPNDSRWATGDETSWNNNANLHWGADAIRLPETWEFIRSCSLFTVNVGVFDHMFYDEHEDLSFAETFLNSFTDNSHGTHVAGIIAATQDNGKGISGVSPNAKLYGYSVNGRRNQSDDQKTNVYGLTVMEEQAALTWFICLNDCKIINYSWGKPSKYTYRSEKMTIEQYESGEFYNLVCEEYDNEINPLIDCLNQFLEEGYDFLIVASAGNNNNVEGSVQDAKLNSIMTYISTPELHNRIIVVGSAGTSDNVHYRVSDYSNYGMRVDLLAPGENIYSTVYSWDVILNTLNGGSGHSSYDYMSGTSMAAPQVSGTAAVIWGINPELTGPEVKRIITETATGMYSYRFDQSFTRPYIYPMLDAYAAVKAAYATITTNEDWASIYRDYVIGGGITYTYHPAENSWEDPYYTDIFGLEYYQYNDDYLPICFSLYDMDRNGVPELFGYNGGGEGAFGTVYAFTVEDGEMKYLGDVATREGAVFYYDNDLYPGVFDESMHMDYHGIGYSYLEDGELKGTLVASYESWFDAADEMHERLTERTSDESLWSVCKNDTPKAIESYTIKEIESMSWEVFVMQVQP